MGLVSFMTAPVLVFLSALLLKATGRLKIRMSTQAQAHKLERRIEFIASPREYDWGAMPMSRRLCPVVWKSSVRREWHTTP